MIQLMHKKLNKKGFTLAELLVVIAILAILVAIAIPIFSSQLAKAQEVRDKANIRSVKAAAITKILSDGTSITAGSSVYAQGTVTADGDVTNVSILASGTTPTVSTPGNITYTNDSATITVEIKSSEVTGG